MTPRPLTSTITTTMTTTNGSASTDPEYLFESRTVDEIAEFSRSLSRDIDRKREELRTMVGERYRDLMEAADTIARMKQGAQDVIDRCGIAGSIFAKKFDLVFD